MEKKMASRPVWNGAISFGLVTIPVALHTAVREKRLAFRTLHDQDHVPLKQKMICPSDGKEIHPEHMVKGYEIQKDEFVVVRQEELEAVAPRKTKAIEIQDFVDLDEIDPVFFDRPYYVAPKPQGIKPYKLLVEAMRRKKKVGIARVVMHNKEYLVALRPLDDNALCMETMHFGDEVINAQTLPDLPPRAQKVDDRELKMAEALIESLTTAWDPAKYHDTYREQVLEMIQRKAKGERVQLKPAAEPKARGGDLMAALEASLAKAKNGDNGNGMRVSGNGHHNGNGRHTPKNGKAATAARRRKSA